MSNNPTRYIKSIAHQPVDPGIHGQIVDSMSATTDKRGNAPSIRMAMSNGLPAGAIVEYTGNEVPDGYRRRDDIPTLSELNDKLTQYDMDNAQYLTDKFRFATKDGKDGYIKKVSGADTFFPFSSGIKYTRIAKDITTSNTPSARTYTFTEDGEYLIIAFHGNSGGRALTLSLDTTNVQQTLFNTENFYEGSSADSRCVTCLKIVKAKNGDSITVNSSSPGGTTNAGYIVYKLKGFNFNTITKITAVGQENVVNNSIPISSKGKYLTVFTSTNALIKNYVTEDTIMFIREFIIDADNQPVSFIIAISEQEDNSSIPMVTVDRLSLGYYGYSYYLGQIQ